MFIQKMLTEKYLKITKICTLLIIINQMATSNLWMFLDQGSGYKPGSAKAQNSLDDGDHKRAVLLHGSQRVPKSA